MSDPPALSELLESLQHLRERLNFFEFANRELSHAAFLAYALKAYSRSELHQSETSAARFGEELFQECFSDLSSPSAHEKTRVWREKAKVEGMSLRPDFTLSVEKDGQQEFAVLETKLNAPASRNQLESYLEYVQKLNGREVPTEKRITLYKARNYYGGLDAPDAYNLLLPDDIHNLLKKASGMAKTNWLVAEYSQWISAVVCRDRILSHPEYQEWFFTGKDIPDQFAEFEEVWPDRTDVRRRVHWHLMRRSARRLESGEEKLRWAMKSKGNIGDSSAWVQLRVGVLDTNQGGYLFYRIDEYTHGVVMDFRVYAGPKQTKARNQEKWKSIKKDLLNELREILTDSDLDEQIQFPGTQQFRFEKSARETSLCRIWLAENPKRVSPKEVVDIFPTLHSAIGDAFEATPEAAQHLKKWIIPPR